MGNCSWKVIAEQVVFYMNAYKHLVSATFSCSADYVLFYLLGLQTGLVQSSTLAGGFTVYRDLAEVSFYCSVLNALMLSLSCLLSIHQQPPFQKNLNCKDSWLWDPHSGGWQLKATALSSVATLVDIDLFPIVSCSWMHATVGIDNIGLQSPFWRDK